MVRGEHHNRIDTEGSTAAQPTRTKRRNNEDGKERIANT